MESEIKFRVYNYLTDEFIYSGVPESRGFLPFWEKYKLGYAMGKLQRFTGIRDKNGKDIYEGDIVTFRDCCGWTLTKKVEWIEEDAGFYPFGADYGCGDTVGTDHEVIGNIDQNPALVEKS